MSTSEGQRFYKVSTAFERNLEAPVLEGLVTVGRFLLPATDSATSAAKAPLPAPGLACASNGQKVILHNNNTYAKAAQQSAKHGEKAGAVSEAAQRAASTEQEEAALVTLTFGKEPTCLVAGRLRPGAANPAESWQDVILYGASNTLLAYDAEKNRQVFYRDVEDGVCAVVCGPIQTAEATAAAGSSSEAANMPTLAVVGGNCSVYGFDAEGAERLWTVTGDQVSAMMLLPWTKGAKEPLSLVAASADCEMRVFRGEEAIASIMEVDRVRQLVPMWRPEAPAVKPTLAAAHPTAANLHLSPAGHFAYLLDNGTVGIYQGTERVWRIKGKSVPVSAAFCDIDCDGVPELIVGWRNGRVEVRSDRRSWSSNTQGGEVLYRAEYTSGVAGIVVEDYRQDGRALPLVCTTDGMVRGLTLLESRIVEADQAREIQAMDALTQQQQALAAQLKSLEEQLAVLDRGAAEEQLPQAGITIQYQLRPDPATHKLNIRFDLALPGGAESAEEGVVIHSCVLQSDKAVLFNAVTNTDEDTACFFADKPIASLNCPVAYPNNVAAHVQACLAVGVTGADRFQVFNLDVEIPQYVMYQLPIVLNYLYPSVPIMPYEAPKGFATLFFSSPVNLAALEAWLRKTFSPPPKLALTDANDPTSPVLHLELVSVRDGTSVGLEVINGPAPYITVRADRMVHCGAIISSLGNEVSLSHMSENGDAPVRAQCSFPEMQNLRTLIEKVDALNSVRQKLSTDMADAATAVKTLLIRAEDARLLEDVTRMKRTYASLFDVDNELIGENMKRTVNYEELRTALKDINMYIQNAAKLRLGPARAELIGMCRNALKESRTSSLIDIIETGSE